MKWIEWIVVGSLVAIGLGCLTVSATSLLQPDSLRQYLQTLVQLCLWIGFPVLVIAALYWIFGKKK